MQNRTPQRETELIAFEGGLLYIKEVPGVQVVVPKKLEKAPVELICSRLCHSVDDAAGSPAVFSREEVGEHAEFANRFHAERGARYARRCSLLSILNV